MIKLIIFDLDGTLVNAYPAVSQSVNDTLKQLGFPRRTHADIKRSVGWGDRHLMAHFVGEDLADKAMRLYRPHHAWTLASPGSVKFLAGTKTLLPFLRREGYRLAIASNRPTRFTRIILKVLGIRHYFDMVLCADRAQRPKPYPDMLFDILKRLKVPKSQALYVGDMTIDVTTGQRAGIKTIAVTTGSSTRAELKRLKPAYLIAKINQVKIILNRG